MQNVANVNTKEKSTIIQQGFHSYCHQEIFKDNISQVSTNG